MIATRLSISCIAVSLLVCAFAVARQDNSTQQQDDSTKKTDKKTDKKTAKKTVETISRPMTDKERKAKDKAAPQRVGHALPEVAERGRGVHHHR